MVIYRKFCNIFILAAALLLALPPLSSARGEEEVLRVLLSIGSHKEITLSLDGDFLCQGQTLTGGSLTCSVAQKGVRLSHSEAGRLNSGEEILLEPLGPESTFTLEHRSRGTQTYAGRLQLSRTPKGYVRAVNGISVPEYQYGVLLGELPDDAPPEGAKALAVAARCLALYALGAEGPYDITDGGENPAFSGTGGPEHGPFRAAAAAVEGQLLTYHNQLFPIHYCRGNGGRTRLPEQEDEAASVPVYQLRYDPADLSADPAARTLLVTGAGEALPRELCAYLLDAARALLPEAEELVSVVRFAQADPAGLPGKSCPVRAELTVTAAREVRPLTLSFDLADLAGLLGAENWDVCFVEQEARGALIVFSTVDGHGVGLSRRGLLTMAQEGLDYRGILSFYYPGARLEGAVPPPAEAAPADPLPAAEQAAPAPSRSALLPGDLDGDGSLTKADAALLTRYVLGLTTFSHQQHEAADLNGDGRINLADLQALRAQLA